MPSVSFKGIFAAGAFAGGAAFRGNLPFARYTADAGTPEFRGMIFSPASALVGTVTFNVVPSAPKLKALSPVGLNYEVISTPQLLNLTALAIDGAVQNQPLLTWLHPVGLNGFTEPIPQGEITFRVLERRQVVTPGVITFFVREQYPQGTIDFDVVPRAFYVADISFRVGALQTHTYSPVTFSVVFSPSSCTITFNVVAAPMKKHHVSFDVAQTLVPGQLKCALNEIKAAVPSVTTERHTILAKLFRANKLLGSSTQAIRVQTNSSIMLVLTDIPNVLTGDIRLQVYKNNSKVSDTSFSYVSSKEVLV